MARILIPLAAGLVLLAIVTGRDRDVDHELHVITSAYATQGATLPVRAHLYAELRRPQGAELAAPPTLLRFTSVDGRELARAQMRPAYGTSLEASLALPADFTGRAVLRAEATVRDDQRVVAEAPVVVERSPRPIAAVPRPMRALQQFSQGTVHSLSATQPPPSALRARVSGGACVPEERCELWVFVGEPAASVRVEASASVTPDRDSAVASAVTALAVPLRVVVHGAEAQLELVAERAGEAVARRRVRLPVAQASHAALMRTRLAREPALVDVGLEGAERGCIVDGFRAGVWLRTGSLPDCRGEEPLPFPALDAGLWRLQLRRDLFSADWAAVHTLYVRAPGESDGAMLRSVARAALAVDAADPLATRLARPETEVAPEDVAASVGYLAAILDERLLPLPTPASSYPRALAELAQTRSEVRQLALVVLVLCAGTLGLLVARRGLSAASEAARIMSEAGEAPLNLGRQKLRRLLGVFAVVLSLLLAFAAIAMYVIARGRSLPY